MSCITIRSLPCVIAIARRVRPYQMAPSRSCSAFISAGVSGRTGTKQASSNLRIVCLSMIPAACRSLAVSWIEAIASLRYCFVIVPNLVQGASRSAASRHARTCSGHPRGRLRSSLAIPGASSNRVDGRDKHGHDGGRYRAETASEAPPSPKRWLVKAPELPRMQRSNLALQMLQRRYPDLQMLADRALVKRVRRAR